MILPQWTKVFLQKELTFSFRYNSFSEQFSNDVMASILQLFKKKSGDNFKSYFFLNSKLIVFFYK